MLYLTLITKSKAITEPRLVASYDIWPGIGVGLFQFLGPNTHIYIYLLYIFTYYIYLLTYLPSLDSHVASIRSNYLLIK